MTITEIVEREKEKARYIVLDPRLANLLDAVAKAAIEECNARYLDLADNFWTMFHEPSVDHPESEWRRIPYVAAEDLREVAADLLADPRPEGSET